MTAGMITELIGYAGSLLVVISMLMSSITRLRIVNSVGCVVFTVYALIIKSYPTAAMQLCIIVINAVSMYKLYRGKHVYSVVQSSIDAPEVRHFLSVYQNDMQNYFSMEQMNQNARDVYLVFCKATIAGILIAEKRTEDVDKKNVLDVQIDYTTPAYRDTSVGQQLYKRLGALGIQALHARTEREAHRRYLKHMGFEESGGVFIKAL